MIASRPSPEFGNHSWGTWIVDHHMEYSLPDPSQIPKRGVDGLGHQNCWPIRIERVWSQFDLCDLFDQKLGRGVGRQLIDELAKKLPDNLLSWSGGFCPGYIWRIGGTYEQHLELWRKFYASVFSHATGGDDDTFDYWPNAVAMCKQMAEDLDEMNPEHRHMEELKQAYIGYIKDFGPVLEYNWNPESPMPEESEDNDEAPNE